MDWIDDRFEAYAREMTEPEPELLTELIATTEAELEYSDMLSGRIVGKLLQFLIRLGGAKQVLEVGTFTGYGSLMMAEALGSEGEITTIDVNEKFATIARSFFERSGYGNRIRLVLEPALEAIPKQEGPFDLIFLDADKTHYPQYYDLLVPKLSPCGLLVVDNTFWSGEVLDPSDHKAEAIDEMNRRARADERVESLMITVRDGVMLLRKRA